MARTENMDTIQTLKVHSQQSLNIVSALCPGLGVGWTQLELIGLMTL